MNNSTPNSLVKLHIFQDHNIANKASQQRTFSIIVKSIIINIIKKTCHILSTYKIKFHWTI